MSFQAVYRRLGSRENAILAWCEVATRNRVAKTPDFSMVVNAASMGVVMGRAALSPGTIFSSAGWHFYGLWHKTKSVIAIKNKGHLFGF